MLASATEGAGGAGLTGAGVNEGLVGDEGIPHLLGKASLGTEVGGELLSLNPRPMMPAAASSPTPAA